MMKIYISKVAGKKFDKLPLKSKKLINAELQRLHKGNISKLRKLPATSLYFCFVGSKAIMFAKENGNILILADILTKKELMNEMRKARFGI